MKTISRILLLTVVSILSLSAPAVAQVLVQIEADGEIITRNEGATPPGNIDTQDYAIVLDYQWAGESERDAASGLPTGKRRHRALTVVKPISRSSVLLRRAWELNQTIQLTFRVFEPNATSSPTEVYRVDLVDGSVVGIQSFTDATTGRLIEELQFAYTLIQFTDVRTGTSTIIRVPPVP